MPIQNISATTLQQWLGSGQATLIDVREPAEFASGYIEGAILLPLAKVRVAALPADGKKLVLQCKAGRRGETACSKLLNENPALEIYHLQGGIDAWVAADMPITSTGKKILPLDRQVQLTVGTILLASSISGYASANPILFLITGLIGCGLSIAGLTGFCGLMRILAKMPWNQSKIGL